MKDQFEIAGGDGQLDMAPSAVPTGKSPEQYYLCQAGDPDEDKLDTLLKRKPNLGGGNSGKKEEKKEEKKSIGGGGIFDRPFDPGNLIEEQKKKEKPEDKVTAGSPDIGGFQRPPAWPDEYEQKIKFSIDPPRPRETLLQVGSLWSVVAAGPFRYGLRCSAEKIGWSKGASFFDPVWGAELKLQKSTSQLVKEQPADLRPRYSQKVGDLTLDLANPLQRAQILSHKDVQANSGLHRYLERRGREIDIGRSYPIEVEIEGKTRRFDLMEPGPKRADLRQSALDHMPVGKRSNLESLLSRLDSHERVLDKIQRERGVWGNPAKNAMYGLLATGAVLYGDAALDAFLGKNHGKASARELNTLLVPSALTVPKWGKLVCLPAALAAPRALDYLGFSAVAENPTYHRLMKPNLADPLFIGLSMIAPGGWRKRLIGVGGAWLAARSVNVLFANEVADRRDDAMRAYEELKTARSLASANKTIESFRRFTIAHEPAAQCWTHNWAAKGGEEIQKMAVSALSEVRIRAFSQAGLAEGLLENGAKPKMEQTARPDAKPTFAEALGLPFAVELGWAEDFRNQPYLLAGKDMDLGGHAWRELIKARKWTIDAIGLTKKQFGEKPSQEEQREIERQVKDLEVVQDRIQRNIDKIIGVHPNLRQCFDELRDRARKSTSEVQTMHQSLLYLIGRDDLSPLEQLKKIAGTEDFQRWEKQLREQLDRERKGEKIDEENKLDEDKVKYIAKIYRDLALVQMALATRGNGDVVLGASEAASIAAVLDRAEQYRPGHKDVRVLLEIYKELGGKTDALKELQKRYAVK